MRYIVLPLPVAISITGSPTDSFDAMPGNRLSVHHYADSIASFHARNCKRRFIARGKCRLHHILISTSRTLKINGNIRCLNEAMFQPAGQPGFMVSVSFNATGTIPNKPSVSEQLAIPMDAKKNSGETVHRVLHHNKKAVQNPAGLDERYMLSYQCVFPQTGRYLLERLPCQ